jgi:hypothetical protein
MQFSREPVAIVQGLLVPILMSVVLLFHFPDTTVGVVNAALLALGGFIASLGVGVDAALPLLVGLAKALLSVLLAFGLHVPEVTQTVILTVISIAVAFFSTRPQVTAKVAPAAVRPGGF